MRASYNRHAQIPRTLAPRVIPVAVREPVPVHSLRGLSVRSVVARSLRRHVNRSEWVRRGRAGECMNSLKVVRTASQLDADAAAKEN